MSKKRFKMSSKKSKKLFRKTASKVHPKNGLGSSGGALAMRGGLRF